MKHTLLILCLFSLHVAAQAQSGQRMMQRTEERHKSRKETACPRVYIGFSTGINNPVGVLGPQVDIAISPSVSLGTGVGISSWGTKTFIEGRYYFKQCHRGWAVAGGFTYNTGLQDAEFEDMETVAGKATVRVDERPQANFMFSGYHFFNLGRAHRNRFHLQAGYSIPLTEKHYEQTYGPPMTRDAHDAMLITAPGGLILGLGFSFGLGAM